MRALVQRVSSAKVEVKGKTVGQIKAGLCVFIGVCPTDTQKEITWMAKKLATLRIFEDENEKMNLSIQDIEGSFLIVSQFTLYADCSKGCRPSFLKGGDISYAKKIYTLFLEELQKYNRPIETGVFQKTMQVSLKNEGPSTFHIETPPSKC